MLPTLEILFKNDDFVIINKPAGWLSVPAREPKADDQVVTQALRQNPEVGAAWPVHRLDRFTSGVMLVARTVEAQRMGTRWFETREVKKIYHFFASPPPTRPAIQMKTPVDGKPSQTLFEVIEKKGVLFWGKATPLTGRFHQIRDHAAQAGFPILGDPSYRGLQTIDANHGTMPVPRVCLHACRLATPLGEFEAPLAEDMFLLWKDARS